MINDYAPLELISLPTKHDLYIGHKDGAKVFIKKYLIRSDQELTDKEKMLTEMACYERLPQLNLPKLIESNAEENYIVMLFIDYRNPTISNELIDQALALHKGLRDLDSSFLKASDWSYYSNDLFAYLDILQEKMGSELDTARIKTVFLENQNVIEQQELTFSHGDFHFDNVRWRDDAMVLIDLENAHRDNIYYDLASMYQSFFHIDDGVKFIEYFYDQISSENDFDENLFRLMLLRRCVNVLYYLRDKAGSPSRAQSLKALSMALNGDNLGKW
jgi:thiamine kinase-like enzyme